MTTYTHSKPSINRVIYCLNNPAEYYAVSQIKFGKRGKETDKTTIIYNENITLVNVPSRAYEYVVNGKSAIDWVCERQTKKIDKDSKITNDSNRYAQDTIGNAEYPLRLLKQVIALSLETLDLVDNLPELVI